MKITIKNIELSANVVTKNRRNNSNNNLIQNQQPIKNKINKNKDNVSTYEYHAYVVIGPRNVSKTYYILKMLKKQVKKDRFV